MKSKRTTASGEFNATVPRCLYYFRHLVSHNNSVHLVNRRGSSSGFRGLSSVNYFAVSRDTRRTSIRENIAGTSICRYIENPCCYTDQFSPDNDFNHLRATPDSCKVQDIFYTKRNYKLILQLHTSSSSTGNFKQFFVLLVSFARMLLRSTGLGRNT